MPIGDCSTSIKRAVQSRNARIAGPSASLARRMFAATVEARRHTRKPLVHTKGILRKDLLDPVPESDFDEPALPSALGNDKRRPRALTVQSENSLTSFVNGHHKPIHKHNNMAHKCGLPYVIPRAHTIHGSSPSGLANRSVDNLPHTNTVDALHSESHIKDSIVSAQQEQRMVKSEHGSPVLSTTANLGQWNDLLPPLDISSVSPDHIPGMDGFSNIPDHEQPLFSAGLSAASVDWSHYDGLDFNNDDFATSSYSQPPSFTGFDFNSIDQPALTTTSTSGEISEVEDFGSLGDPVTTQLPLVTSTKYGSDFDASEIGGEIDGYRLSTASSYVGLPQVQMLAGNNAEALDLETFLKSNVTSNMYLDTNQPLVTTSMAEGNKMGQDMACFDDNTSFPLLSVDGDNDAFWMNDFTSSSIAINGSGYGELPEENVWAQ
ncbi:Zinc copper-regulated transcription factor [Venustampulla echinocandica]|uniref:Zinc copper-regulated transcription factor n=1 Tax=Venustampulla echinocandica TaxID=2656787 RepID=A0A370TM41_9HELO|nr:Zinc copper-regulated transcription factor [Venustampulla echinocandica]RDL36579.1 Zinc copper-regulated transcription factor [Venustampulla echinocandica]